MIVYNAERLNLSRGLGPNPHQAPELHELKIAIRPRFEVAHPQSLPVLYCCHDIFTLSALLHPQCMIRSWHGTSVYVEKSD
jgi:hypothetical protein